jgi:hypothetical protein
MSTWLQKYKDHAKANDVIFLPPVAMALAIRNAESLDKATELLFGVMCNAAQIDEDTLKPITWHKKIRNKVVGKLWYIRFRYFKRVGRST